MIEARDLGKSFLKDDRYIVAVQNFSLTVQPGSFVCMLGRSGCGKSTILNLMAGLTKPTEGEIIYRGAKVTRPNPDVGYLTQSDTLMPWRDVRHNVELPLEIRGTGKTDKTKRHENAQRLIDAVGLASFERHYPRELSGGMRRRASLARLLINQPDTLLLDEPFGALDAYLRKEMQDLLLSLTEHLLHTASDSELTTLIEDYLPSLTPAVVAAVIPLVHSEVPATPAVPATGYQSVAAFHKDSGLYLNPPSYGTLIDSSLISAAVAKAGS